MSPSHSHKEAFMVMKYASADGRVVEFIWNSRDGVTPFIIHSRDGVELSHVEWKRDRYLPEYRPQPGERIFVDLTPERARASSARMVEQFWDAPQYAMRERYESQDEAIAALTKDALEHGGGGAPDLIEASAASVPQAPPSSSAE